MKCQNSALRRCVTVSLIVPSKSNGKGGGILHWHCIQIKQPSGHFIHHPFSVLSVISQESKVEYYTEYYKETVYILT